MEEATNLLTIIGYSFGDAHINSHYISHWLNQDVNHRIRIIDPGFKNNTKDYVKHIKLIRKIRRNQIEIIYKSCKKSYI
jgi:hypothetical protein